MKKRKVTIKTMTPISGVIPNTSIHGYVKEISLTTEQIRKCIVQKASVSEILPNGLYKHLDLTNYDKIEEVEVPETPVMVVVEPENKMETSEEEKIDVPKEEIVEPVAEEKEDEIVETVEEPVVEEAPVEEVLDATVLPEEVDESTEEQETRYPAKKKNHKK